jgi:hypothetical protein
VKNDDSGSGKQHGNLIAAGLTSDDGASDGGDAIPSDGDASGGASPSDDGASAGANGDPIAPVPALGARLRRRW